MPREPHHVASFTAIPAVGHLSRVNIKGFLVDEAAEACQHGVYEHLPLYLYTADGTVFSTVHHPCELDRSTMVEADSTRIAYPNFPILHTDGK